MVVCGATRSYITFDPGAPYVGTEVRYKVNNISGTDDWNFSANFGGSYVTLPTDTLDDKCHNMGFTHGYAEGEVSVRGSATSAFDHQSVLQRKNCGGSGCSWDPWNGLELKKDTITGWWAACSPPDESHVRETFSHVYVNGPLDREQPDRAIAIMYDSGDWGFVALKQAPSQLPAKDWLDSAKGLVASIGQPGMFGDAHLVVLSDGSDALLKISADGKHSVVDWLEGSVELIIEGPTLNDDQPIALANMLSGGAAADAA